MTRPLKETCCERFLRKDRACKACPLMAPLAKGARRRLIAERRAAMSLAALADPNLLDELLAWRRRKKRSHLDALFEDRS